MEKTIKYLENGEYHYATVRSVGDLAQLKTTSKETLVEAINELWNGGGNVDPSKVPNPEGYDKLVQDVADAVKNQQETNQQWIEWKKEEAQLTEERKQAYLQAMKEMQEAIDKAKADAAALGDKTAKLDEQITKTFSELNTNIQNMHEQLQKEADRMNQELIDTKSDLTKVRTDLQNAQLDNGRIHDELTNINGKFEHKVWQTDLDPLKAQIDRAETSVQQTKDELLGKASREDLDTVTNAVSKLDTQLKETAKGVEISVKKDELGGDVARLLNDKTNLLLGTRSFSGEDNWRNRDKVTIEPGYYKGMKTAAVQVTDASIYQPYRVKANTAYTFSFFGKEDRDNPKATLAIKPIDAQNVNVDGGEQQVHITTEWQRFAVTFSVDQECEISIQIIQGPEATNNILHLAGLKLQYGQNDTPWEPNEADVAENIEHTESQFNVYSDQIAGIVKKQEKMGDTERQLDTRITETAEGLKQTSKDLQDANGKITEFKGQLESTAHGLKTEYEKYTNDAVGQISDSTLNLIRNSSFQNKDEDFAQWQNISAKANVRQDENGLRWVELTQSGLTTGNPQGLTSNYFNVKQGKVTVAVDIKAGDKATLDNESVLFLELYNDAKKRVDFRFVTLSELGLSKNLLDDHKVHRGLYRLGIDRNDAKYMTVKAHLMRNGDLYFTNFSARLSSIDDGAYEPNPDDVNQQILKQNTKIEQNAKEVAIKANSVDVTRDIKSAVQNSNGGGVNLLRGTSPEWKTLTGGIWFTQTTSTGPIEIGSLAPGDTVTYTITVRNNSQYAVYPEIIGYSDDSGTRAFGVKKDEGVQPGETKTVSMSAAIAENTIKIVAWLATNDPSAPTFSVDAKNEKLEKGSVATPWTPAYEDISTEIKSAKDAAIQVASDQINIHVNELTTSFDDKLNKRINEQKTASEKFTSDGIEQVVTKITNVKGDVDRLGDTVNGVGSRNLLHNTSDQYRTLTGSDWFAKSTANDIYTSVANYHGGNQFTYAATITNPSNYPVRLVIYCYDKSKSKKLKTILGAPVSANQPNARVNVTTVMDTDTWWIRTNIETLQGNTPQISIQVKDERLVEGTVSSSWSPNPDDINQQIANTNKKIDTQTLDSANIDEMKTQGHYFVHNLMGNPIGGWVYVDVTGNNNDRIRQDVYQDSGGKHMSRRLFGNSWSGWEQGAYISDVNNVKTEVTASVKNLGDRVITQVNSVETKVDGIQIGGRNLAVGTDKDIVIDDTNNKGTQGWQFVTIHLAEQPKLGDQITISAEGVLTGNGHLDDYTVILYNETTTDARSVQGRLKPGQRSSATVKVDNINGVGNTVLLIYAGNPSDTQGKKNVIHHLKIEKGNKPTEWSLAPEDTLEAIKEVNTKWDVANGQIQGKVTETQVNNILNGKGYATQSWAQTQFQMRSDAITLQAVRDNITNGIQNQVNSIDQKLNNTKIGNKNLFVGTNRGDYGWMLSPGNGATSKGSLYIDGQNGVRFTNSRKTTSWWVIQFPFDMNKLKPNTSYTISFDIRTPQDRNENAFIGLARGDSSGSPFVESPYKAIHTKANQFVHITQTLTTTSNFEKNQQAFYFNNAGIGQCDWVDIVNLMMVEGTQSAEWSPAPEEAGSGQNLLRGTADFSWPTGIGTNGNFNTSFERFDDTSIAFHLWGSKGGGIYTKWGGAFPDGQLQVGETYTFSFDIKGSGTFASIGNESHDTNARGLQVPGDWQRVSISGTIKALDKVFIIYFRDNFDVRIKNVKIERGSKATPWTPHPFDDKDKGINLLKSTAYWNPNDWNHIIDGKWYNDNWADDLGHKAYGRDNAAWDGLGQTVYVTPGVYTWSAQIYLHGFEGNDSADVYYGDNQYNGTVQIQQIRKPGLNDRNKWINYSTTFYVKNAGNLCVRPELNQNHGAIHVGSQKLEHGMVATSWTPSPLDDKNATITLDSADVNNMKTQGHYFVRNLANNPIGGWVYVDVTGNNNDRLKQEVYQDNGYEHRSRRWTGSGWTEWTTDVNNKNVVSQINITPDQIKIASNKIVIDGNTDIHGVLRVPDVKLAGRNGNVDLSGDGINITKTNGAGINIASNGIQLTANTNGQNEIEGVLTTAWSMNNKNQNGIGLVITPEQTLGRPYGGDILTIGEMVAPGTIHAAMVFDATGINPDYKRGFNWFAPHTLNGDGGVLRFPGAQDDLMLYPGNMPGSRQSEYSQPTLRLVHGNSQGSAGIQFQWDDIVPFGRIETSHSVMTPVYPQGDETNAGLAIGWVSWFGNSAYTQGRMPMIHRVNGNMHVNAGFAFFPDGNVVYWNGSKRANLTWAFAKYDPYYEPEFGGF